jgi:hypothetical protein
MADDDIDGDHDDDNVLVTAGSFIFLLADD